MSCSLAQEPSVQAFESCGATAMGLLAYPGVAIPDDSQYALSASRSKPAGSTSYYAMLAEACLRARGLIYFKVNPGDCGAPNPANGFTNVQIVGLAGTAASGVTGGLAAAGAISGAATFGIGAAVSVAVAGIEAIFQEHAIAVANEQATLCKVANYFNPLVGQIDAAVRSGAITPSQGIAYMNQICNTAQQGLDSITKPCNAACVYSAICQAFSDFANYFYNVIAPPQTFAPQAPGAAPSAAGSLPGGVPSTAYNVAPPPPVRSAPENTYAPAIPNTAVAIGAPLLGYNQPSGQAAQATDVPPPTPVFSSWLVPALVVAAVAIVIGMGK